MSGGGCGHVLCQVAPSCLLGDILVPSIAAPEPTIDGAELLRRVRAARCRQSLAYFVQASWRVLEPDTPLHWNRHHEEICNHVQGVFEGWLRRKEDPTAPITTPQNLAINVPPGSLKSRIIAVCFNAWAWTRCPSWKVICLSVNAEAAQRDARYTRELVSSEWYRALFQPQWELRGDQDALGNFANTAGGSRLSRGAGAEIVGLRADCVLMDDPNNPKEAQSAKVRREVNELWDTNTYNRVNNPEFSIRIIVQQRVHEEDLTGWVTRRPGWCHLWLPAEFEADRACRTVFGGDWRSKPGESIHPSWFTPGVLASEKALGSYRYAGQYQQRPAPAEGGMFKRAWFKTFEPADLPKMEDVVISVDPAGGKETEEGSATAMLVVGRAGPYRYILDNDTRQRNFRGTMEGIQALKAKWPRVSRVLIEEKVAGISVVDELRTKIQGVIPIKHKANDSKERRAEAIQAQVESECVLVPKGAPWLDSFLHEVCTFPAGAKDDQVDAFTQALNYFRESSDVMRARMLTTW